MWDEFLQQAFTILTTEDKNQREFWKIAFDIRKDFGSKGLKEFSDNLKENFGVTKSYNTLRQYAYVHELVTKYDLPEDLTYTAIRQIPTVKDPEGLIKRIKEEGLSSAEIIRLAYQEKPKKERMTACPACGFLLNAEKKKKV